MAKRKQAMLGALILLVGVLVGLPALAYSMGTFRVMMYHMQQRPCPSMTTLPRAQGPQSAVLQGESGGTCAISPVGVRYGEGQCLLSVTDLGSGGGNGWSQTRSVNPAGSLGGGSALGMEWSMAGFLSLVSEGSGVFVRSGSGILRHFTNNGGGVYGPTSFYQDTLVTDAPNNAIVFTDTAGSQWTFNDFLTSPTGQLKSYQDPAQNLTTLTYGTSGVSLGKVIQAQTVTVAAPNTITETWTYDYFPSGTSLGFLQRVSLARSLNGGASTLVSVLLAGQLVITAG